MSINYERVIPNIVGPRLAYYGFSYDKTHSYPPEGYYSFCRKYWCASQCVSISLIQYDEETVEVGIAQNNDRPSEVPRALLQIKDPGFRMWLSNKYILGVLESDNRAIDLTPNQPLIWNADQSSTVEDLVKRIRAGGPFQSGKVLPTWWEFSGEADLKRILSEIVNLTVTQGLDWFDHQVIETRRYHEKLDRRRKMVKSNDERT